VSNWGLPSPSTCCRRSCCGTPSKSAPRKFRPAGAKRYAVLGTAVIRAAPSAPERQTSIAAPCKSIRSGEMSRHGFVRWQPRQKMLGETQCPPPNRAKVASPGDKATDPVFDGNGPSRRDPALADPRQRLWSTAWAMRRGPGCIMIGRVLQPVGCQPPTAPCSTLSGFAPAPVQPPVDGHRAGTCRSTPDVAVVQRCLVRSRRRPWRDALDLDARQVQREQENMVRLLCFRARSGSVLVIRKAYWHLWRRPGGEHLRAVDQPSCRPSRTARWFLAGRR